MSTAREQLDKAVGECVDDAPMFDPWDEYRKVRKIEEENIEAAVLTGYPGSISGKPNNPTNKQVIDKMTEFMGNS